MKKENIFKKSLGKLFASLLAAALIVSGAACESSNSNSNGSSGGNSDTETTKEPEKTVCSEHTDADDNGLCDVCNENVMVNIDIYAINDIHGRFDGAVGTMTAYFEQQEASDPNSIILSSGDSWQGSSESNNTKGALMTEWMQEVGFVSMTLGNHEFDWGTDIIEENEEEFGVPFLAINVYSRDTDTLVSYCQPSVMVTCGGVKVGIIGAIGDCYSSIEADKTEDVYFKVGKDLTELVKAESEKLRAEGAEIIVYSLHDGYSKSSGSSVGSITDSNLSGYYDVSLSDGYVDVVFEAHTHKEYVLTDKYGVYHIQAGGENSVGLSHADINFNIANDNKTITCDIVNKSTYASLAEDAVEDDLLAKYADEIGDVNSTVATLDHTIDSDGIADLVAELYYKKGLETWGEEYDITLAGGYIKARKPYNIYKGDVTYADVQAVLPFDNEICLCSVSGINLNNNFFENQKYAIYYEDYGEVVKGGIEPNGTYYIVVDSYTATYAPNHLTTIATLGSDLYARDLVVEYLKEQNK